MAARKPSRYLAPIALLAIAAAIFMVVRAHVDTHSHSATSPQSGSLVQGTRGQATSSRRHHHHHRPATYTVKSGDTLSGIAASTGVPEAAIQRLNPGVNPNALQTGQVLRLRR